MIIPALSKRPIIGNLLEWRRDRLGLLQRAAQTNAPLTAFHIGSWPIVLINDLALIEQVLVSESAVIEKSLMLRRHLRPLLGDGLLTSDNATNRRHKRILGSAFQPLALAQMFKPVVDQTLAAVANWRNQPSLRLDKAFTELTLAIMGQTLFGTPIAYTTDPALQWALTELNHYSNLKIMDLVDPPLWLPLARHRRLKRALAILDNRIYQLIEQRKTEPSTADLLGLLLAARDEEGAGLTEIEIRDELATFFLAGHETTTVALQWAVLMLHHHPELRKRLRTELFDVLQGQPPQVKDLERLPLLRATVNETLRLYPPVYVLARSPQQPIQFGEYLIPKGCSLAISPYTLHRRADLYPNPERFNPDRWLDHPAPPRFGFLPFGAGPRQCIGKQMATMELMVILATLIPTIEIAVETSNLRPEPMVTLRHRGPLIGVPREVIQEVEIGAH